MEYKRRRDRIQHQKELNRLETTKKLKKQFILGLSILSGIHTVTPVAAQITPTTFIHNIGESARKIASQNDLYASVMIAQAALESGWGNSALASEPYFNLFGIKGDYNGQTVNLNTLEDDGSGTYYEIKDGFRDYDNYEQSLNDYANVLTGLGSPWRENFYAGARRSNTTHYSDATTHLTGRYATDTRYKNKLNTIIESYDLTAYDAYNAQIEDAYMHSELAQLENIVNETPVQYTTEEIEETAVYEQETISTESVASYDVIEEVIEEPVENNYSIEETVISEEVVSTEPIISDTLTQDVLTETTPQPQTDSYHYDPHAPLTEADYEKVEEIKDDIIAFYDF